jgi:DNA modification methylase
VKPYYQAHGVTLYHGDACRVLANVSAECDLIIADPPYGVAYESGWRQENAFGPITGDHGPDAGVAILAAGLQHLREYRHVYVFGRFNLSALPLASSVELVWDKGMIGMGDLALPWGPQHEPITFAVYVPSTVARSDNRGGLSARLRRGSVIRCQRPNSTGVRHHPTEKPVELLRQLIESSSVMGETVLDPCCGSGSTLIAAALEGRRAIGIEVEERNCETTARRLRDETSQPSLFFEAGA